MQTRAARAGLEFFWVALGQALAVAGSLAAVRVLTGLLPPADYGVLALALTGVTLVQQVVFAPAVAAALRWYPLAKERRTGADYAHAFRLVLVSAAIVALLLGGLAVGVVQILGGADLLSLAAVAAFGVFSGASSVLDAVQVAARRRRTAAFHQALGPWLRLGLAVGAARLMGPSGGAVLAGFAVASLLVLTSQQLFLRSALHPLLEESPPAERARTGAMLTEMLAYAWPLAAWSAFTWANVASDRWSLQAFEDAATVGRYAVLYQLGYVPVLLAAGVLEQLAAPVVFQRFGAGGDPERMRRLLPRLAGAGLGITAIAAGLAWLLHGPLFSLLAAKEYHGASAWLPVLVASAGVFASGQVLALIALGGTDSRSLIVPKIGSALAGIALNAAGAAWFGLAGVVLAGLAFSVVYLVWVWMAVRVKR